MDVTVTTKGQITIPKPLREHLKVKPGGKLKLFIDINGRVVILPTRPVTDLRGMLKTKRQITIEQMNEAIGAVATARAKRR